MYLIRWKFCLLHKTLGFSQVNVQLYYIYHAGSQVDWNQSFMQGKIIASHTCFDGHMDVNC